MAGVEMSRKERWGTRDQAYSKWHRRQSRHLAYIDLDGIECCSMCKQPIALIELAIDVGQTFKATTIMCRLAKMAGLPAYLVFYKKNDKDELVGFRVSQVAPEKETERIMTPEEYIEFLCAIRDPHPCYQWNNPRESQRGK